MTNYTIVRNEYETKSWGLCLISHFTHKTCCCHSYGTIRKLFSIDGALGNDVFSEGALSGRCFGKKLLCQTVLWRRCIGRRWFGEGALGVSPLESHSGVYPSAVVGT